MSRHVGPPPLGQPQTAGADPPSCTQRHPLDSLYLSVGEEGGTHMGGEGRGEAAGGGGGKSTCFRDSKKSLAFAAIHGSARGWGLWGEGDEETELASPTLSGQL